MGTVSVVAALVSVAGALVTVVLGAIFERGCRRAQRREARSDLVSSYRDPLLQAASSLASRLGNADPDLIQQHGSALDRHRDRF